MYNSAAWNQIVRVINNAIVIKNGIFSIFDNSDIVQ